MEGNSNVIPISAAATEMIDKKFIIGVSLDHNYGIVIEGAATPDEAMLKFDDWLRGTLPPEGLAPEIRASNLSVIGLGVIAADGSITSAGEILPETSAELNLRGALPDAGCLHLFSAPTAKEMEEAKDTTVDMIDMGDITDAELRTPE